jgi:hypothetical protein
MKMTPCARFFAACALASVSTVAFPQADPGIAHLEKRGAAVQLVVDGQPYLVLGGELANTASSSLAYMKPVWPRLARMNLNTAITGVSWAQVEPQEGAYDFSVIDGLLEGARASGMHVIFIWFGSWKNGISSFAPAWVKADQDRFPRAKVRYGHSVEVLSTLSDANRDADARAYSAFMRHLRETDSKTHTVLMIQLENEVGLLGDSRDRSAAADAAFAGPVPAELTAYLAANRESLRPGLRKAWEDAGSRASGTWEEVFGSSPATDEYFMAWHYARYMDQVAAAGKAEYPVPVFTNTWIVQPEDKGPGDYPSGGPEPHVLDLWRAGAPHIDMNAPDIYLPNFTDWVGYFHQNGNPLFVPESRGDAAGVGNAFYAIGRHSGMGYSPMGIDDTGRLLVMRPSAGQERPADFEGLPLPRGYAVLRQLAPQILDAQAKGAITAASLTAAHQKEDVTLGDYTVQFDLKRNFRDPNDIPPFGYGLAIATGPNEYLVAGFDIQVTFAPAKPGPPIAGLAHVEAGEYVDGRWVAGRLLNGDDVLLNYHLADAAAHGQSGSGLRFQDAGGPTIQRVTLYRYGP